MMTLLKGKLTYIMAGLAVVYGLVGLGLGWINQETAISVVWSGLAVFGVRRAIGN